MLKDRAILFSPLGSPAFLVYPYQTAWQWASNAGGVGQKCNSQRYLARPTEVPYTP